ncbi:MAG: BREX-2 system adenine-specific DNA-methyltransferase PglX [Rhodocyclaceae bacterium]|nr:BREX-2 system adenine-specific DNA-methyltransferase PglX [Rhodocyclaceae bacterium]
MIDAKVLLADLTRLLKRLEDDLRERALSPSSEVPEIGAQLQAEWQAARDAARTAETFESWAEQVITQSGVHWLLSCVFLRFIEDNGLVDRPWISGTPQSGRLALARDRHDAYFREHPHQNDRDYLIACFREAGALPGLHTFFDEAHNPVFRLGISGDAAMAVMQFWQEVAADSGALIRDFTDTSWNTRFLGDLYQDLSEATRKRYALLQTPEFVEEFILDRTLTPAIREFGYREVRMIDPTCGSGHFLLGGFHRLVEEWSINEPGRNRRDIAQKALDAVAGVDLNPFAVAIARFRLLLAALQVSDVHRMAEALDFKIHVAIGDSLLHGRRFGLTATDDMFQSAGHFADTGLAHAYASEDLAEVQAILGRQYHAVVGNPPYIVVKDAALNAAYRKHYASCHMKYSLGAPFTERFFELALTGREGQSAGFVGLITANSFMKREFGSKLIEQVLPRLDLSHVVDTSGAYIPGHGTPTVILFGRHRAPVGDGVRTVMGIKGEPSTPDDPAQGLVWAAIVGQIDRAGSESEFVSTADTPRATFAKHPWSIGGGGAAELTEAIEEHATSRLNSFIASAGFMAITGEDEAFLTPTHLVPRLEVPVRDFALGDEVRDWSLSSQGQVIFPYIKVGSSFEAPETEPGAAYDQLSWRNRSYLRSRVMFGKTAEQHGFRWDQYMQFIKERVDSDFLIAFAEVATHNHFVLDRGGKVFKQTAPVIKLPTGASEDEHLGLLGLLNSSVACFWLKQVSHQKQMMGGDGIRISEKSKVPYQFASTRVQELPLPAGWENHALKPRLTELAREADSLAGAIAEPSAAQVLADGLARGIDIRGAWQQALDRRRAARSRAILVQEEIDFTCYAMYGLAEQENLRSEDLGWAVEVEAGDRPFCIASQRNVDGFDVPAEIPPNWPSDMRSLWTRRIQALKGIEALRVIEEPHYKRRWIGRQGLFNHGARADEFKGAARDWLLTRLESPRYWPRLDGSASDATPQLMSSARLADAAGRDAEFMQVAALYAGHADFDLNQLVANLVTAESVPFLPVLRYTDTGLRKRDQWEDTWALQRREDAGEDVGKISVPPKYQSKDFLKADFWRLRGGLDVPKERWISYPGCERGADGSLVIAWSGWDHLQQATALAAYFIDMKEREGWSRERLQPLLAGLLELVPWLKQWHNEMNPDFGARMGDYYESFVTDEARALQFTLDELRAWKPAATAVKRGRKKSA